MVARFVNGDDETGVRYRKFRSDPVFVLSFTHPRDVAARTRPPRLNRTSLDRGRRSRSVTMAERSGRLTHLEVLRTEWLTPHMIRVVAGGPGLADFRQN